MGEASKQADGGAQIKLKVHQGVFGQDPMAWLVVRLPPPPSHTRVVPPPLTARRQPYHQQSLVPKAGRQTLQRRGNPPHMEGRALTYIQAKIHDRYEFALYAATEEGREEG